jgi:hypothetical protein
MLYGRHAIAGRANLGHSNLPTTGNNNIADTRTWGLQRQWRHLMRGPEMMCGNMSSISIFLNLLAPCPPPQSLRYR